MGRDALISERLRKGLEVISDFERDAPATQQSTQRLGKQNGSFNIARNGKTSP